MKVYCNMFLMWVGFFFSDRSCYKNWKHFWNWCEYFHVMTDIGEERFEYFFLQHLHPHSKKFKHEKDISPTLQEDFIFCNIFKILSCFLKFCEITSKYNPTIAVPFCFMVGLLFLLFVGEKFPVKLTQQWKFNENIIFFYGVKWRQKKQTRTKSSNLKLWLQSPVLHTARTYVSPCMR